MKVPVDKRSSPLIAAWLLALCLALFAAIPATAPARMHVAGAVAVGSKPSGIRRLCLRMARRKLRRLNTRATFSKVGPKKIRRTKATVLRRCTTRRRRNAQQSKLETPNAHPAPGPLAIGIDGGYGSWWGEEVEFRKALDAPVTRHEWDPASESVDAQDKLVLQAATEVHTRIHALLGGNDLGDPAHYREWVVSFVQRYGVGGSFWSEHPTLDAGRYAITTFELGNEPYFGTMSAADYADTVRPTLEAVHRLGLPAKLILPSYIYGDNTHWIDTLYQRIPDLNSLFYAFADHPYWYGHSPSETGDGNSPFDRIETLREKMAEHGAGSKPLFITEYGESTADCGDECVSEQEQADHIREVIEAVVNRPDWGVELLCLYQLHDWATASSSREQEFGLLREDGTHKEAYGVAHEAMQQYRG